MKNHWHDRYLRDAQEAARNSKDRRHKVGAVLFHPETHAMLLTGFNGLVRGMDDMNDQFHEQPLKDHMFEHAERNLLYFAARFGFRTEGLGIAASRYPCAGCARGIVQSGLSELVTIEPENWEHPRWGESWKAARKILNDGGVVVHVTPVPQSGVVIELDPTKYPPRPRAYGITPQQPIEV